MRLLCGRILMLQVGATVDIAVTATAAAATSSIVWHHSVIFVAIVQAISATPTYANIVIAAAVEMLDAFTVYATTSCTAATTITTATPTAH